MSVKNGPSSEVLPSRDKILKEVKKIVAELAGIAPDKIQEYTDLDADLNFDSLERVECAMEIEEQFDITVSDDMEQNIRTIKDIVDGVMAILDHTQP
jgi:acyl carrier protein